MIPKTYTASSKSYNGIDLIKFICSILVFCIHIPVFEEATTPFREITELVLYYTVSRLAVPFYFTCSGFFLFRKMPLYRPEVPVIKEYCYKILRLFAIWNILLAARDTGHLWYLSATVVAVITLSILLYNRIRVPYLCLIGAALYAVGLLGDSYYGIAAHLTNYRLFDILFRGYNYFFLRTRNGIFMGFIFVLMGAVFARCRVPISPQKSLLGFLGSVFLLLVEVFTLKRHDIPAAYNMYIFLLPAVFFLFSFAVQWELPDRPIYRRLRTAGLWLYLTHQLVDTIIVQSSVRILENGMGLRILPYRFLLSLTAAVMIAFGLEALSRRKNFKWLNLLIT